MMGNSRYVEDDAPVEYEAMGGVLNRGLFSTNEYACQDQLERPIPRVPQPSRSTTWMGQGYIEGAPRPPLPIPIWVSMHPDIQPNQAANNNALPNRCGRPVGIGQELECH